MSIFSEGFIQNLDKKIVKQIRTFNLGIDRVRISQLLKLSLQRDLLQLVYQIP
jgi:hypothetical protein